MIEMKKFVMGERERCLVRIKMVIKQLKRTSKWIGIMAMNGKEKKQPDKWWDKHERVRHIYI